MKKHPIVNCPDFRRFFCGRIVSAIGDKFYTIAIAWWVISHKGNIGLLLGILMAANVIPIVLFGPLSGILADRWDRRKCMLLASFARCLSLFFVLFLSLRGHLSIQALFVMVFCTSSFSPLFESAATSSLANLVEPENLSQATALNASVVQFSNLLGATLGGFFLAIVSINVAIAINVITFAISFFLVWTIRANLTPQEISKREPYSRQFMAGFSYIVKKNRPIGWMLTLFSMSNFFASSIMFFIPLTVKTLYHGSVTWVAVMEGSMSAGFVIVSIALSFVLKWGNVYMCSFLGGLVIFAAFVLFLFGSPLVAAGGLFFMGLAIAWSGTSMQILFQRTVEAGMKGRFFALMSTMVYVGFPLSFLLNGFLLVFFSLEGLLLFNGFAVLAITFGFLFIPRKEIQLEVACKS